MTEIYLDNHTTTALDPQVIEVMGPFLSTFWGNYLQPHQKGQELIKEIHQAYQLIYDLIKADPVEDELIFTASCEEAISHVYHMVYKNQVQGQGKNHFLTLATEDAAILMNLKKLEPMGCLTHHLELNDEGVIKVDKIAEAITPRTAMVSLSLAHGLTGIVQPIEKLKELCRLRGILLHLDISYAVGKIEIDIHELGADFITFGGDKFHGPKSSGILYVRQGMRVEALIAGGLEQKTWRGGILDVSQLAGLAKACELAQKHMGEMCLEIASLRSLFEKTIEDRLGKIVRVLFSNNLRLPNVSVITFKNIIADALLYELNHKKVYATLGGVRFQRLSHILEILHYSSNEGHGALSFAISRFTTKQEIMEAAEIIIQQVERMQSMLSKEVENGSETTH